MRLSTIPTEVPPEDPEVIAINDSNARSAEMLHGSIQFLNRSFELFWAGTFEEIVARFNKLGVDQVRACHEKHKAQVDHLNPAMDAAVVGRPRLASRLSARGYTQPLHYINGLFDYAPVIPGATMQVVDGVFGIIPPTEEP
jgi:hypothetical protein